MSKTNVYVMVGLPGSGKSTYIENNFKDIPVVSRDIIRANLGYITIGEKAKLSREQEMEVTNSENKLIDLYCKTGQSFVIDDTNLNPRFRTELFARLRKHPNVRIVAVHLDTPLSTCIERRKNDIPSDIMKNIASRMSIPSKDECDDFITVSHNDSNPGIC